MLGLANIQGGAKPSKAHTEQWTAPGSLAHHSTIIHPWIETESILTLGSLPSFITSERRCSKSVDVEKLFPSKNHRLSA